MRAQLWYTAAIAISLCAATPAVFGASAATPDNGSTSTGAASSNPNSTTPGTANPAPAAGAQGTAAPNGVSGAPSNAPYPLVTVKVNGKQLATQGILINGRTLVPIIDLVEKLDGKAMWDSQSKTVWAAFPRQKRTLRMVVGSPEARIYRYDPKETHRTGGLIATTRVDQPPLLLGGYVVAPAEAAANIVHAKVYFNPDTKQVSIISRTSKETASR